MQGRNKSDFYDLDKSIQPSKSSQPVILACSTENSKSYVTFFSIRYKVVVFSSGLNLMSMLQES